MNTPIRHDFPRLPRFAVPAPPPAAATRRSHLSGVHALMKRLDADRLALDYGCVDWFMYGAAGAAAASGAAARHGE